MNGGNLNSHHECHYPHGQAEIVVAPAAFEHELAIARQQARALIEIGEAEVRILQSRLNHQQNRLGAR